MSYESVAEKYAKHLIRGERKHPYLGRILVQDNDAPYELGEMIREVHGSGLPCDWTYEMIGDALDSIQESGEEAFIDLDALYPSCAARNDWYSSTGARNIDPEEWGIPATNDLDALVASFMWGEAQRVMSHVLAFLRDEGAE